MRSFSTTVLLVIAVGLVPCWGPSALQAQGPGYDRGTVGAGLALRQLGGAKRVLMIGAHPDDEDTSLLSALARGEGVETAYLALTRGDGGQNLIGPELWEGLGAVRTGELLAARALDGGRQFFTRAFDFGYSKTATEALGFWPREDLLRDVTWVVRTFRPHVIVSVFSGTPSDGHGQHQAAGIMAREVFEAAGDPSRYPELEQQGAEPWQPAKLFILARGGIEGETLEVPTGTYDPLIGRSFHQLAMESRSQHRSQDMGAAQSIGPRESRMVLVAAAPGLDEGLAGQGIFAGVDTTVASLLSDAGGVGTNALETYLSALAEAGESLDVMSPERAAPPFAAALEAWRTATEASNPAQASAMAREVERRTAQVQGALLDAAGIVTEVRTEDDLVVPGETFEVSVRVWNGGPFDVRGALADLYLPAGWGVSPTVSQAGGGRGNFPGFRGRGGRALPEAVAGQPFELASGEAVRWRFDVRVPPTEAHSRPYYLEREREGEMYVWPDSPEYWGLPKSHPLIEGRVRFQLDMGGSAAEIDVTEKVEYVGVDPAFGEFRKPLLVVPPVSVTTQPRVVVWPVGSASTRTVSVALRSFEKAGVSGTVRLEAPAGWSVEPSSGSFSFSGEGQEQAFGFQVGLPTGAVPQGQNMLRAVAVTEDGRELSEFVRLIDYPHIERTALFESSELAVNVVPVQTTPGLRVAYIMGTGDSGVEALREIGIEADVLTSNQILAGDYSSYDVVVVGIRGYEARDDLRSANEQLLQFARNGGTVVVQYNQYTYPGYAPYPVDISRPHDRVTDQGSPFRLIDPEAPIFVAPNQINESDFDGWVTERGLYFLGEWDDAFTPTLELVDPGEEPKSGALMVAPVGEGVYVYSGLSFFRQLPAGVPGAYRLLANLVSLKGADWAEYLETRANR